MRFRQAKRVENHWVRESEGQELVTGRLQIDARFVYGFTFPNWSKYCFTSSMVVLTDRPPTKIFFVLVTS